jgi:hypothetical protein
MPKEQHITILDVLENALGGDLTAEHAAQLTEAELDDLADRVNEFYSSYSIQAVSDDLRFYSGGWVAGNWDNLDARKYLLTSLVYYPSIVIHDPIAEWFFRGHEALLAPPGLPARNKMTIQATEPTLLMGTGYYAHRSDLDRTRGVLAKLLPLISELAVLFREGIVVPISQWQLVRERQQAILTAVRHDNRDDKLASLIANPLDLPAPRADHIRGLTISQPGGWRAGHEQRALVQDPAYFLNKTLAIADIVGARYIPPAATDAALLDVKLRRFGDELKRRARSVDLIMVPALESAQLPFLEDIDPKTLVAIRTNEEAFDDWRRELRTVVRNIEAQRAEGDAFAQESSEILRDALLPRAREVSATVSTSAVLKKVAKEQSVTLTIGAASTLSVASVLGTPVSTAALVGLGMSGVARWIYGTLFRQSPSGSRAVMAKLIKR